MNATSPTISGQWRSSSAAELEGLPQDYIDRHKPGADGKITITTDYPDVFPILKFGQEYVDCVSGLYEQFDDRAYPKNRDLLMKMMQTRYEIATAPGIFVVGRLQRRRQNGGQRQEHRKFHPRPRRRSASARRTRVCTAAR